MGHTLGLAGHESGAPSVLTTYSEQYHPFCWGTLLPPKHMYAIFLEMLIPNRI